VGGEDADVPSGGACERPGARVRWGDNGAGGASPSPGREAGEGEKRTDPIRGPSVCARDDSPVFLRSTCENGDP